MIKNRYDPSYLESFCCCTQNYKRPSFRRLQDVFSSAFCVCIWPVFGHTN